MISTLVCFAVALLMLQGIAMAASVERPPNIVVFLVDDMGWTQVGYHARALGNHEYKTPHIDEYAASGIELDRGYMTPWCGPSRAAIQTGRTNSYNPNVSQNVFVFDSDIGFISGLPPGTKTMATALKEYGKDIGLDYKAYYNGKWGIGGIAWTNTPMGMGYDEFRGFWSQGIDPCDGTLPFSATNPYADINPLSKDTFGPTLATTLGAYWEQSPDLPDTEWCGFMKNLTDDKLTPEEKFLACKTRPRIPPKHIDLDLVDSFREEVISHDYEKGPFLQFVSTAMMHTPLAYPEEYDLNNTHLPAYFSSEAESKPSATNNDTRLATVSAMMFLDDVFGMAMQTLKDAGQWNNTIVLFSSDNGGCIYGNCVNNNYPLRASKFSPFEGGIRVPQFLTGGWIERQLPENRLRKSGTYFFPHDIAPTLLEMSGASVDYLLDGKSGASYGNAMWEYIKNSVDPAKGPETHQKPRKVAYSPKVFFDVQLDRTMKTVITGNTPQLLPRLSAKVWPTNDDLITDPTYFSVNPCRPNGIPSQCCYMNIEEDPTESNPLAADCNALHQEGKTLFVIEGGCDNTAASKKNWMCLRKDDVDDSASTQELVLWTHYAANGPALNSKGQPITGLPMKCVCDEIDPRAGNKSIDGFAIGQFTSSMCFHNISSISGLRRSVRCDGTFSYPPIQGKRQQLAAEGIDMAVYARVQKFEFARFQAVSLPLFVKMMFSLLHREGFRDWAHVGKMPFNVFGTDSCKKRGIVPVPYPANVLNPFSFLPVKPDLPYEDARVLPKQIGLCQIASPLAYFCPSRDNRELKPVKSWMLRITGPVGVFSDNTQWRKMGFIQCIFKCRATAKGTLYIGDGQYGMTFD
jgi:arylsulfatase B/arylsulfatase I/J